MITADLLTLPGVLRHGFFTRQGGVSTGIYSSLNIGLGSSDERAHVLENRGRVAAMLNVRPEDLITPYQVHSPDVITVSHPFMEDEDRTADALVTATPGLAIGVSTADCGPVLFADPQARVIGAAHAGWRGALTGVLDNTLTAMEKLGARRENIIAVLGPCISAAAYEVGPEFRERFEAEAPGSGRFFGTSGRENHFMFDLQAFIIARLQAAGAGRAESLDLCTYADEARFFSYRRTTHRKEPDYGRQISALVLTGD